VFLGAIHYLLPPIGVNFPGKIHVPIHLSFLSQL
jgi:hypothetical protein